MSTSFIVITLTMPDPGLKVGEKAPDFVLPNAFGKPVRLNDLLAQGPVVLTFYRGAWCPYCNLQLRGLNKTLPYIEQEGARLVAITPQKPDKSLEQVQKDGYPFEVLSDLNDQVMKKYQLFFEVPSDLSEVYKQRLSLDLAKYNGEGRYVLPVPATFVIDRSGTIKAAYADVDYRNRVEPTTIIAELRALTPAGAQ
jgi:peroxiredoxin